MSYYRLFLYWPGLKEIRDNIIFSRLIPHFIAIMALISGALSSRAQTGSIDSSFTPGPLAVSVIKLGVQSSGKVILMGTFTNYGAFAVTNLARLNTDGTVDKTFSIGGFVGTTLVPGLVQFDVDSLVVQSDDKLLIGGTFDSEGGVTNKDIVRLLPNGAVDTTFHSPVPDNTVRTVAVMSNGKIVISGSFKKIGATARPGLALLNSDGSLDTTFAPSVAPYLNANAAAIQFQAGGKIVLAGGFITASLTGVPMLRFESTGALDATFTPPPLGFYSENATDFGIQPDGKYILVGNIAKVGGADHKGIVRLNPNGSVDATFPGAGLTENANISSILMQTNGKAILGGTFVNYNNGNIRGVTRLNADGSTDASFDPKFPSTAWASAMVAQSDGKIVVGGVFTLGTTTVTLLRLLGDGAAPSPPVITTQPASQTVAAGAGAFLTVLATGTAPLTFQWYKDGAPMTNGPYVLGSTNDTLTLLLSRPEAAGTYTVVVKNSAGSVTSTPAVVKILSAPAISTQPASQSVAAGATATFNVQATGSDLTYAWYFNNGTTSIGNGSSLVLSNVQPAAAGDYRVVIANSLSKITSSIATLTITVSAPVITTFPTSVYVALPSTNLSAANLTGHSVHLHPKGAASPFTLTGDYDVLLPSSTAYNIPATNGQVAVAGTWLLKSELGIDVVLELQRYFRDGTFANLALQPNGHYELYPPIGSSPNGDQNGDWTLVPPITTPAGTNVTFTVVATGPGPLSYQWKKNGIIVPGATNATFTVTNVSNVDFGYYLVTVSNAGGSTPSAQVILDDVSHLAVHLNFSVSTPGILHFEWPSGYKLQAIPALGTGTWSDFSTNSPADISTKSTARQFFRVTTQ